MATTPSFWTALRSPPTRLPKLYDLLFYNAKYYTEYRNDPPLTLIVAGMHRSGTSCIARMLNLCGASLGDDLYTDPNSNPLGHWEDNRLIELNQRILWRLGSDWKSPPDRIRTDPFTRFLMRGWIAKSHTGEPVRLWKDPRIALTLPEWSPLLSRL